MIHEVTHKRSANGASEVHNSQGEFLRDIHGKSDRAVAIIGAALLNAHIEQLLKALFVDDPLQVDLMLDSDRAIGSFGARIRLAYLLGLVSREEFDDLAAINRIHEVFSREIEEVGFTDLPVRAWSLDLILPTKIMLAGETRNPREMYVFTVALMLRQLDRRIYSANRQRRRSPEPFSLIEIKT